MVVIVKAPSIVHLAAPDKAARCHRPHPLHRPRRSWTEALDSRRATPFKGRIAPFLMDARPPLLIALFVALLGALAAGCTEPNPDFVAPPADAGALCTPGDRQCEGEIAVVCVPTEEGEAFVAERTCPESSSCSAGACVPTGAPCELTCEGGEVCTLFVDPEEGDELATYCAAPAGDRAGGSFCSADEECQSGLCIGRERYRVCFAPCDDKADCAKLQGHLRCQDLELTLDGVRGEVKGCQPSF